MTQKFQARLCLYSLGGALYSKHDTDILQNFVNDDYTKPQLLDSPTDSPTIDNLLSISTLYEKLHVLIGYTFKNPGKDQERKRGIFLQKAVSNILGYKRYEDNGQFPDVVNQVLELKLQTSPTIDLGLVIPSSTEFCNFYLANQKIRHCDIRYAIFDAKIENDNVIIQGLYLSTGKDFFNHFQQFSSKKINKKYKYLYQKVYCKPNTL